MSNPPMNTDAPHSRAPLVDAAHPWLGLLPFREAHRGFFFGRDAEITEILDRIRENPLTILYGQSGLGKTSLLNAGVIPRLREAGLAPILLRLDYDPSAPSLLTQTIAALQSALPSDQIKNQESSIVTHQSEASPPLAAPPLPPPPPSRFPATRPHF